MGMGGDLLQKYSTRAKAVLPGGCLLVFVYKIVGYVIFMFMNQLIKILATLLLIAGTAPLQGQILWERNWGAVWEDACEVRALPDGGSIFLASIGTLDSWLVRMDPFGDTLWSKRITFADFCTVQQTLDGGFFLGGTTRGSLRQEIAYRVDQQGDSIWAYIYPDSIDHGVYTAVALPNSNFLLTGYSRRNNYDMWARCIDETGLSLWAYSYGTGLTEFGALPTACADGGFLLSTTQNNPDPEFYMVRIDENGQVMWTRNYSPTQPVGAPVPTALPDGGFVLLGWIQQAGNQFDSYLLRTDSAGSPIWARSYGGLGFEERSARGALLDARGGFTFSTITQGTFGPDDDRDIALLRLDTAGNLLDQIRIGRAADDVPRYFDQTIDSSYVVLGYTRSFVPTAQQVYLVKVDPDGCNSHFYWPGFPELDTICPGDSVALDAGPGFLSYAWSNGDTGRFSHLVVDDTIYVAATDANGCVYYSNYFRGSFYPTPSFSWSAQGGNQIVFDLSTTGLGTWDFGDGSPVLAGGDVTHTYALAGNYLACFTESVPGCGSYSVCDTVSIQINGLQGFNPTELLAFPNPSTGTFYLQWPGRNNWQLELCDVTGRLLFQQTSPIETFELALSEMSSGIYFLRVCTATESTQLKLVRN